MRVARYTNKYGANARNITSQKQYRRILPTQYSTGWITSADSSNIAIAVRLRSKTGGRRQGFRLPTDFGAHALTVEAEPYDYTFRTGSSSKWGVRGSEYNGAVHGVHRCPGVSYTSSIVIVDVPWNLMNEVATRHRTKLQEVESNLLETAAELRKSADMLARRVKQLLDMYRAVRRRDYRALAYHFGYNKGWRKTASKDAANAWLEYSYGWMPLVHDIYGIAGHITDLLKGRPVITRCEAQSSSPVDPWGYGEGNLSFGYGGSFFEPPSGDARVVYRIVTYQKMSIPLNLTLHAFGLDNPFLLAWELLPYSFVLDWLIPVGSVLEALMATSGWTFMSGFEDRIRYGKVQWSRGWSAQGDPREPEGKLPKMTVKHFSFQRRVLGTWPLPGLYIKNPFSTSHVTSAAALLRQRRG